MGLCIVRVLIIGCIQNRLYIYMAILGLQNGLVRTFYLALLLGVESLRLV